MFYLFYVFYTSLFIQTSISWSGLRIFHRAILLNLSLLEKHIPPNVKVGAFQSGCLSYWLDNKVINLHGVVNEDAYLHSKNKTLGTYLDDEEIDYIVEEVFTYNNWDNLLNGQLSERYDRISLKQNKSLPQAWNLGIYRRKQEEGLVVGGNI